MLGRATVREALLSVAPFLPVNITSSVVRPYVLQQLVHSSTSGDIAASKLLLSLPVPAAPKVNYTRSPSAPAVNVHHGGNSLGVRGQVPKEDPEIKDPKTELWDPELESQ